MPRRRGSKTALVLASGGLAGVAYEVGALRALDQILTNRTVNDFDIYVGTSAGAVVAASLACGMPPIMLAGLLAGTVPGFRRLNRMALYRLNIGEIGQRLVGAPGLLRGALSEAWRYRDRVPLAETLYALAPLPPAGSFTNGGLTSHLTAPCATAAPTGDYRDVHQLRHTIPAAAQTHRRG